MYNWFSSVQTLLSKSIMDIAIHRVKQWTSGTLDLSFLELTELPELPNTLTQLYCHNNNLTKLPELPKTLTTLYCFNNNLTELPKLPKTLRFLSCKGNHFPNNKVDESIPDYMKRYHAFQELKSKERIIHRCSLYFEELMMKAWHPDRVEKWMLAGVDMEEM